MGVDAIDQTICLSVLGMTKCSIAFGRWPHHIIKRGGLDTERRFEPIKLI